MKILLTNDDGIQAEGLWALAKELKNIARVVVVAPDREQSALGTAITLSQPVRVQKVKPLVPGIETYAVEGTLGDSVILALEKLVKNKIDLVISGINQGLNLGNDVLVSGTVGAALQGYLRRLPALAISIAATNGSGLDSAVRIARLLVAKIGLNSPAGNIFLNVNLPDLPPAKIKGIKLTCLARASHIDTVEEGHDGKRKYYWLVRQRRNNSQDGMTDIGAIEQGNISITPLHIYRDDMAVASVPDGFCSDRLCSDLFRELPKTEG